MRIFRAFYRNARKRCHSAVNFVRSKAQVGDYWFWIDDRELEPEFLIWPLIYPFRYDVLIRRSFFELYSANKDIYLHDCKAFIDLARAHPYFEWFSKVLVVRYLPQIIGDEKSIATEFENRVSTSVTLYESIMNRGFDANSPIILYTGKIILPADTGRQIEGRYFMGDGCHRLACLMAMGYESLPKKYVKVKCFNRLIPLDNTRLLAASVSVDKEWV